LGVDAGHRCGENSTGHSQQHFCFHEDLPFPGEVKKRWRRSNVD
jgi:hypothetical protein